MASRAAAVEGGDTRERILEAALTAFAENGFDGARTREIADRAGVPLGLLQYHFGGKQKLWRAAVDRAFEELRAEFASVLAVPGPADFRAQMRRLLRRYVHFVARKPEFVRLMHDEGKRRGPRMRWMVDRHVRPVFGLLLPLAQRLQAERVLPGDIAPIHFVYILAGAVGLIFHQAEECRRVSGIDPADPAEAAAHARAVEHLLLGPADEESPR
jgi:TetR/AcrR family transcriptional regulator